MTTISLEDKWIETARLFGDVESVVRESLKAYLADQCRKHVRESGEKVSFYAEKYGCDYTAFRHSVQTDGAFLELLEARNPLWEEDAMEWDYWMEEYQAWQNRLGVILKKMQKERNAG